MAQETERLLVIHVIPTPDGGGAQKVVRDLVGNLHKFGVDAQAVYLDNPRSVVLHKNELCLNLRSDRSMRAYKNLRRTLLKLGVSNRQCVVHAHLTAPLYHISLMRGLVRGHLVFTEHSSYNKRREFSPFRFLERSIYRKYDKIISVSQGVRNSLRSWLKDPIKEGDLITIYNGSALFPMSDRSPPNSGRLRLLSVGSLVNHKGFDLAIRAVKKMPEIVESYTIAGDGPEKRDLQRLALELGIEDRVDMIGQVENLEPLFANSDLVIIPSRWEGFGLVAIEALSVGLPLVTSDVSGLSDVVSGCQAVVPFAADDVSSLMASIRFANDYLVRDAEIPILARKRAEMFNVGRMLKAHADLYKSL